MKIILLIDSLGAGGAQRQIVGLSVLLRKRGYDVTLVYFHDISFYLNILQQNNISFVFLKKAKNKFLRLWIVTRYLHRVKPDVVVSYLETPSIYACIAKMFNSKFKLIVSERNTSQRTGLNEIIRFNLFKVAEYIVPNAYAQEDYIVSHFPRLKNKIVTIPNFVDLSYFTPMKMQKRREVPEIIVVATIWASKNTQIFIDAIAKLKARGKQFHVSWYGKDSTQLEYYTNCQHKIEQLGVSDYIVLKEKTINISEKYQDSDYFCLPSLYEGTPNVICEAMACGLPIACSDVCDNSHYVEEGVNGFLFNPYDSVNIADVLERMLSMTDDDYKTYCHNSRERAEIMLSKEIFVESYIKLLE